MGLLTLNMFIAFWLWRIGIFTFKSAVLFYVIEFFLYLIFFAFKYQIDDDVEYDLDEIENEEFKERVRRFREGNADNIEQRKGDNKK